MSDNRFMRTELLLGNSAMQNIKDATVAVVGLGAVGGFALEALARAGIGHLIVVDFDRFETTNINRQILALDSTLGQKKTAVAEKRIHDINPECVVDIKDTFVSETNFDSIFEGKIDFVVDAIDSIKEKCDMMCWLYQHEIPFISSMGAALKTDIRSLQITKLSKTLYCPMAKKIRKNLKERGVCLNKIDCVYCAEQSTNAKKAIISSAGDCSKPVLGSMPTITAIMGLMLAHHVILHISQKIK